MTVSTGVNDVEKLDERLKTFSDWTSPKCPTQLALAGYRYTGQRDRVQCDYCHKKVVKWAENDNALEVHARVSPDCKFLAQIGFTSKQHIPRYSRFCNYKDRLESIKTVPEEFQDNLPPSNSIAEAGFFYHGSLDRMACYNCGLVLRDWEKDSDPLQIHRQYSGNCLYIHKLAKLKAGQNIGDVCRIEPPSTIVQQANAASCSAVIGKFICKMGGDWREKSAKIPDGHDTVDTKKDRSLYIPQN